MTSNNSFILKEEYDIDSTVDDFFNVCNLCRLCMSNEYESEQMLELSEKVPQAHVFVAEMISDCLPLKISIEDTGMPTKICQDCLKLLHGYSEFKNRCLATDQRLRTIVKRNQGIEEARALYGSGYTDIETVYEDLNEVSGSLTIEIPPDPTLNKHEQERTLTPFSMVEHSITEEATNGAENEMEESLPLIPAASVSAVPSHAEELGENIANHSELVDDKKVCYKKGKEMPIECIAEISVETEDENMSANINVQGDFNAAKILEKSESVQKDKKRTIQSTKKKPDNKGVKMPMPDVMLVQANNEKQLAYRCRECSKVFDNRMLFRRHAAKHTNARGMTCRYCDKWFPIKSTALRHERIHSGERPFTCLLCNKSFSQKEILRRHILIHSDTKPFKCNQCEKSYTQKEALRVHIKTNHERKGKVEIFQYPCQLCDKAFCHPSGLSRHMQTHAGKRYPCNQCSSEFSDSSSVRRHERKAHSNEGAKANFQADSDNENSPRYNLLIRT